MFGFSKKVDAKALDMMQFALDLTKKLVTEDEGNFVCFNIFGMDNNEIVPFGRATEIFLKIVYCGDSVVSTWRYDDYTPYTEYKSFFKMFEEASGEHSFCAKVNLHNSDAVTLLNTALLKANFSPKADKKSKSIFFNLF